MKVAIDRIRNGERVETLVNHTVYYIVCKAQEQGQDSLSKCSFDDKTFERSLSNLFDIKSFTTKKDLCK